MYSSIFNLYFHIVINLISKKNIEICSMIDQTKIINEMNLKTTFKLMEIL